MIEMKTPQYMQISSISMSGFSYYWGLVANFLTILTITVRSRKPSDLK